MKLILSNEKGALDMYSLRVFNYYNTEHRHSGIGLMTAEAVHYGWAKEIRAARQDTLLSAYALHPERFVKKVPEPPLLPCEAWINPPPAKAVHEEISEVKLITPGDRMLSELLEIDGNDYIEMAAIMQNSTKEVLH